MAEINLAPGSEYLGLIRRRRRRTYLLATLLAVAVAATWGGLFVFQQRLTEEKRDISRRLSAVEAEVTRLGDQAKRVALFEQRLTAVDALLTQHIAWDPFLQDLERLLPPPAVVNRLDVSLRDDTIELAGETPDLDVIAQTLASLVSQPARPTIFNSAALENVSRLQENNPAGEVVSVRYQFGASLSFDSSALRYGQ
jgi:Tfp pilus assembly protein PilN